MIPQWNEEYEAINQTELLKALNNLIRWEKV